MFVQFALSSYIWSACLLDTHRIHREAVIGALLELLEYTASSPDEQSKFKDLTVKCLIKVTKSLDEDIKTDRTTRALITVSTRTAHPGSRRCPLRPRSGRQRWASTIHGNP